MIPKTINVRVIPNAKQNKVEDLGSFLKVRLTAPPRERKANKALIKLLAAHFNIKKSHIRIIKGEKSRDKVISIATPDR